MSKTDTPWGVADSVSYYDPASTIMHASTPDLGGVGVALSRPMPSHLACVGRKHGDALWFDQETGWAAVAIAFPSFFSPASVQSAKDLLMRFHPEAYRREFGSRVTALDSDALEQSAWEDRTVNHFVVTGSFGSWAWDVPQGFVYAAGWRRRDEATAGYLVPERDFAHPERLILDGYPVWEPNRTLPFIKEGHEREALAANGRGIMTSLFAVLEAADECVLDVGERVEVDNIEWRGDTVTLEFFGGDQCAVAKDQPVYVDERGETSFTTVAGEECELTLKMVDRRPVGAVDLASAGHVTEACLHA